MTRLSVLIGLCAGAAAVKVNPLSQVIGLLQDLHNEVTGDAAAEVKAFNAYAEWCKEQAQDDGHQHETLSANIASTKAAIQDDAAKAESAGADVSSLASEIASSDSELAAAKAVREKEAKDFGESEAELVDVVDTLQRAISIIQKEMAKNPAFLQELVDVVDTLQRAISIIQKEMAKNPAFLQKRIDTHNMNNVVAALTAVVDAAAFSGVDKQKLVALVQSRQSSNDDDDELSAPVAAAYKSHSSNIVDVLNDLLDKAQIELDDTRHTESHAAHNFAMLKQSLEDQLAQLNKALEKAKGDVAEFTTSLD
eukprot:CAMPEP_0194549592 /NCGR_PEP_ID=MMETSP0253-20130528/95285_1 /TAXON_ID=2966 /ORGANISM="Noctiluca scintillans" /LENGTH=308 /DNA_ID=CAMNT_0039397023 /DNA_START=76 /DNA_END=1000 /DNA_ORIENTATION=-